MLNNQYKGFGINLNAQHVNGMTQFGYKRFLDTLEMNFMNSMESQENQEMFFFAVFHFIGLADNCKKWNSNVQTLFFWPEKWFLKKVTHFPFFCTNHSSGLLCSCKRFCVVDFWPLFRFFGITKAPFSFKSSQGRRKSSVRTQKEKEFLLWLFGHFCDIRYCCVHLP